MLKRTADIVGAAVLIVATSPVLAIAATAIWLWDHGPVIYRQRRIGLRGTPFEIFKFRTMVINADRIGVYATADHDSRITGVGRILRKTSIDELPQLFNVIRGEMSLIGPRPDVPEQRALYTADEFERRHSVRPGITGLAQATSRSSATPEERKRLDLEYVERGSLLLDVRVLILTLRQVLTRGGN